MLPREFPPCSTVYLYNCSWQVEGVRERIDRELNRQGRQQACKHEYPAAIAVDAQAVKTTEIKRKVAGVTERSRSRGANAIAVAIHLTLRHLAPA